MKSVKRYHLFSFMLPVFILLLSFFLRGILPFGDGSLLSMDAYGQYFPMLKEMKRSFFSGWSFSGGLGFNLTAQNAYYANSPLWLLLCFLPDDLMILGVHSLVLLRFGLAGLFFARWLCGHFGKMTPSYVVFSSAYALSGYTLAFLNQFMWMDAVVLLPLVILGLERLFSENRPALYTLSLALTLWSNFYIGYMVCLFCVLYFLLLLFVNPGRFSARLRKLLSFSIYSLLAGGLAAVTLIPMWLALQKTIASDLGFSGGLSFYHRIPSLFLKLLPCSGISLAFEAPNLYCGFLCVLLCIPGLISRSIPFRKKLACSLLLGFLLLSMNLNLLDFIWHGFHYPNQLPARESFLFIFLLVTCACGSWTAAIKETGWVRMVCALLLFLEITVNCLYTVETQTWVGSKKSYTAYDADMKQVLDRYRWDNQASAPEKDVDFYRMERTVSSSLNSGQLYGYPAITYYSSTMTKNTYEFFQSLGMDIYAKNVSTKYCPRPAANALLSIRYLLHFGDLSELPSLLYPEENALDLHSCLKKEGLIPAETIGMITVLENRNCLPIAWASSMDQKELEQLLISEEDSDTLPEKLKHISGIRLENFQQTSISGSIDCPEDGTLYTSLPCEEGWSVFIDGIEKEPFSVSGCMLAVEIDKGSHKVSFQYEVPGKRTGLVLSLTSAVLLLYLLYGNNRKRSLQAEA